MVGARLNFDDIGKLLNLPALSYLVLSKHNLMNSSLCRQKGYQVWVTSTFDLLEFRIHQDWASLFVDLHNFYRDNFDFVPYKLLLIDAECVNELTLAVFISLLLLHNDDIQVLSCRRYKFDVT